VDFDFYEPIKGALEFLDTRMPAGGRIIVGDYGFFSGGRSSLSISPSGARLAATRSKGRCRSRATSASASWPEDEAMCFLNLKLTRSDPVR
jgi:hypothetical protein